jgi:cobalt-zinc-cadmium resistance protein CzcA
VQRPVFYAIAIIITAYLPIFTLQRVLGGRRTRHSS